jgi:DNA polymerase III delta prime subunit|eukprot:COSAG01_NODE_14261_length_1476_cov_1.062455_2_plen_185_part_00
MSLWLDKYRPTTLDKLTLQPNLTARLKKVANSPQFPHLLFYGPPGAGKRTRVMGVLREMFGPSVEKVRETAYPHSTAALPIPPSTNAGGDRHAPHMASPLLTETIVFSTTPLQLKVEHREFKLEGASKSVELTVVSSNHHVELNPSDAVRASGSGPSARPPVHPRLPRASLLAGTGRASPIRRW